MKRLLSLSLLFVCLMGCGNSPMSKFYGHWMIRDGDGASSEMWINSQTILIQTLYRSDKYTYRFDGVKQRNSDGSKWDHFVVTNSNNATKNMFIRHGGNSKVIETWDGEVSWMGALGTAYVTDTYEYVDSASELPEGKVSLVEQTRKEMELGFKRREAEQKRLDAANAEERKNKELRREEEKASLVDKLRKLAENIDVKKSGDVIEVIVDDQSRGGDGTIRLRVTGAIKLSDSDAVATHKAAHEFVNSQVKKLTDQLQYYKGLVDVFESHRYM